MANQRDMVKWETPAFLTNTEKTLQFNNNVVYSVRSEGIGNYQDMKVALIDDRLYDIA